MLDTTIEKFREVIQVFKSEEAEVRKTLEAALKRREDLLTLPLPKDDFIKLVFEWIDDAGNEYPKILKSDLHFLETQPMTRFNQQGINPLLSKGRVSGLALIWCLREQVKKGIADAIKQWEMPNEVGPSRNERIRELKKLEKEIEKLQDHLARIKGVANSQGVSLTGIGIGEKGDIKLLRKTTPFK